MIVIPEALLYCVHDISRNDFEAQLCPDTFAERRTLAASESSPQADLSRVDYLPGAHEGGEHTCMGYVFASATKRSRFYRGNRLGGKNRARARAVMHQ